MEKNKFIKVAAQPENPNWQKMIDRIGKLYMKPNDIRNEFSRDYTRILHCLAYRRLKHKTQVFFNIDDDHICTRMEHVSHVESVSHTIAAFLGLNEDLVRAVAMGHDLGHAPFGHTGESILSQLAEQYHLEKFWHEKNGLHFVDSIELLEDSKGDFCNLDLTYAVRDGIISHCGEVNHHILKPRTDFFDLNTVTEPGSVQPATWEGCVVKIADKIAYLGRDIEDARRLNFLEPDAMTLLKELAGNNLVNTTQVIHKLIVDICENSSPDNGILLSDQSVEMLQNIMRFNNEHIYKSPRFIPFKAYSKLIIEQIFETLLQLYDGPRTLQAVKKALPKYPQLLGSFSGWLPVYCDQSVRETDPDFNSAKYQNNPIYGDLSDRKVYIGALLDYISGMTDAFIIRVYNDLITF